MKCKAVLREIEELEQGARLCVEADAHLNACASCKEFARERSALRHLLAGLDAVETPPDFDWRLRARLARARSESELTPAPSAARRWLHAFAPGARALTVAASITLLLVAVIIYRQAGQGPAAATESSKIAVTNTKEDSKMASAVAPTASQQAGEQAVNPVSVPKVVRDEASRARGAKSSRAGVRAEVANQPAPQKQRIYSTDSAMRGAEEFTLTGLQNSSSEVGPVISLRVPQPKVTELRLQDRQGVKRTLSTVNFGEQELIDRPEKARLVPASEKGVW